MFGYALLLSLAFLFSTHHHHSTHLLKPCRRSLHTISQVLPRMRSARRLAHTQRKLVLGIETSCDDTAVAIVSSEREIVAEAISF